MRYRACVHGLAKVWQGCQAGHPSEAGQPDVLAVAVCEFRHAYDGGQW